MKWMNQDPQKLYKSVTDSLAVRTEFALAQADELGQATSFEDMIHELRQLLKNDDALTGAERKAAEQMLDTVETSFRFELGLQTKSNTAFKRFMKQDRPV